MNNMSEPVATKEQPMVAGGQPMDAGVKDVTQGMMVRDLGGNDPGAGRKWHAYMCTNDRSCTKIHRLGITGDKQHDNHLLRSAISKHSRSCPTKLVFNEEVLYSNLLMQPSFKALARNHLYHFVNRVIVLRKSRVKVRARCAAAVTIQTQARGMMARNLELQVRARCAAAVTIQTQVRGMMTRNLELQVRARRCLGAVRIQTRARGMAGRNILRNIVMIASSVAPALTLAFMTDTQIVTDNPTDGKITDKMTRLSSYSLKNRLSGHFKIVSDDVTKGWVAIGVRGKAVGPAKVPASKPTATSPDVGGGEAMLPWPLGNQPLTFGDRFLALRASFGSASSDGGSPDSRLGLGRPLGFARLSIESIISRRSSMADEPTAPIDNTYTMDVAYEAEVALAIAMSLAEVPEHVGVAAAVEPGIEPDVDIEPDVEPVSKQLFYVLSTPSSTTSTASRRSSLSSVSEAEEGPVTAAIHQARVLENKKKLANARRLCDVIRANSSMVGKQAGTFVFHKKMEKLSKSDCERIIHAGISYLGLKPPSADTGLDEQALAIVNFSNMTGKSSSEVPESRAIALTAPAKMPSYH